MAGVARSAGFGRIGGEARPSPYTPVHLAPSRPADGRVEASHGRSASASVVVGVAIAVAVLFAVAVGVVTKPRPSDVAPVDTASEEAPALDAESDRLNRSPFAARQRRG